MARSIRLQELEARLSELRRHLLPRALSSTGQYSDRVYDRARAYRLLAHAEVEACIEDLASGVVNTAFNHWFLDRRPRACLISLLAYHKSGFAAVPDDISSTPSGASTTPLRDRLDEARNQFIHYVREENHGIREKHVLRLLLPTGILESDLSSGWLQTIDSFGDLRGTTAHTAASKTQQPPDPGGELQTVRTIVKGLRPIDLKLTRLGR